MLDVCSKVLFCQQIAQKVKVGRSPNAKSGSKVAEHNQDRRTERGTWGGEGEREYWVLEVSSLSGGIHVGFLSIWRSLMVNNSLSNGLEEKVCKV